MFKVNRMFGHHMVLQRNKIIKIWGTGEIGRSIEIRLTNSDHEDQKELACEKVLVDSQGKWIADIPPQEAGFNVTLSITDGTHSQIFTDVGIGEVWIASGQSNMEYQVHFDENKTEILERFQNRQIRHFNYPRISIPEMEEVFDYKDFGVWQESTRENLPQFSSVACYFAEKIQADLNVPIGIIGCNWGGTPACTWLKESYLENNEGQVWLNEYHNKLNGLDINKDRENYLNHPNSDTSQPLKPVDGLLGRIMYPGLNQQEQAALVKLASGEDMTHNPVSGGPHHQYRPGGLYQNMVTNIAPYSVRGVIWYQGESDSPHSEVYGTVFSNLIQCWRDLWEEKLPFLFVQLAPFDKWLAIDGSAFPEIRRQQQLVEDTVENTWMVSSADAGMENDIHPKIKQPIGERLALQALNHIYGKTVLSDAPKCSDIHKTDHRIEITFANADGLHIKGDTVNALLLQDQNGNSVDYSTSYVEANKLVLEGEFTSPLIIKFASAPYYKVNLYNQSDIPVRPFEATI